jgi:hypothetical protein
MKTILKAMGLVAIIGLCQTPQAQEITQFSYKPATQKARKVTSELPTNTTWKVQYVDNLSTNNWIDYANVLQGGKKNVVDVPNYAYFSSSKDSFLWKDLYTYGYIDSDNIGVNYPFLNGAHYPYTNIIFRIIPEGTNYNEQTITAEPIIDDCE